MEKARFFFDQDESSHWYIIPVAMRDKWLELSDRDDDDASDQINELFSLCRIGGGPNSFSFEEYTEEF